TSFLSSHFEHHPTNSLSFVPPQYALNVVVNSAIHHIARFLSHLLYDIFRTKHLRHGWAVILPDFLTNATAVWTKSFINTKGTTGHACNKRPAQALPSTAAQNTRCVWSASGGAWPLWRYIKGNEWHGTAFYLTRPSRVLLLARSSFIVLRTSPALPCEPSRTFVTASTRA